MKSMTGYGFSETSTEQFTISVELKSYNNRYLDINHNIPYFLSSFESDIDSALKNKISRGHVDVNIRVKQLISSMDLHVDTEAVHRYSEAYKIVAEHAHIEYNPTLNDFITSEGVLVNVGGQNAEQYARPLFEMLHIALDQLEQTRAQEGRSTRDDLERLGNLLKDNLSVVEGYAKELEQRLKATMLSRFEELLGSKGYDESRFLQEVAIMLTKYSINEELVRLAAHIDAYQSLIASETTVGKRLDFLCQEMNREVNTIGSKSTLIEINQQVVAMKDNVENIREQIRNIE